MDLEIKEKRVSNITIESLPDDILDRLYQETPVMECLGLEEFLKLPVNDLYRKNKLSQNLDLNSNIIINKDVKTNAESDNK
jgi:hypothetical protein